MLTTSEPIAVWLTELWAHHINFNARVSIILQLPFTAQRCYSNYTFHFCIFEITMAPAKSIPAVLDLSLGICRAKPGRYPHWILIIGEPGANRVSWVHSSGGPTEFGGGEYYLKLDSSKRADSRGITSIETLGSTSGTNWSKIIAAANRKHPQQCQNFVVAVVAQLELKDILPSGTAVGLKSRVQMSETSRRYLENHPVDEQLPAKLFSGYKGMAFSVRLRREQVRPRDNLHRAFKPPGRLRKQSQGVWTCSHSRANSK